MSELYGKPLKFSIGEVYCYKYDGCCVFFQIVGYGHHQDYGDYRTVRTLVGPQIFCPVKGALGFVEGSYVWQEAFLVSKNCELVVELFL